MNQTSFTTAAKFAFACVTASAGEILSNQQFVRLGAQTIRAGDTDAKIIDAGGQPETRTDVINAYGVKVGGDWTYSGGARSTLLIRVSGGRVVFFATQLKN